MLIFRIIFLLIIGTAFGSFWSVLLTRLQGKISWKTVKTIFSWWSQCPDCKTRLKLINLIPIVSYFLQNKKCTSCNKNISRIYPTLEIGSAIIFVWTFVLLTLFVPNIGRGTIVFRIAVNRVLRMLLVYDIKTYELHVPVRIGGLAIVLIPQFVNVMGNYKRAIIGSLLFGIVFYGIFRAGKWYAKKKYNQAEWFGEGDVWLAFLIGALVPFRMQYHGLEAGWMTLISLLLLRIIISCLCGLAFVGTQKLWFQKTIRKVKNKKKQSLVLPFLPAMIVGSWLMVVFAKYFVWMILG